MKKHKPIQAGDVYPTNEGGSVVVVEYMHSTRILVRHADKFGHQAIVGCGDLRKGAIKNPYTPNVYGTGFVGVGPHKVRDGGNITKAYKTWSAMLERCYSDRYQALYPTYAGCAVASDWHNFQNYAEWFAQQEHATKEGFALDKDLMVAGSKIYSQSTCSFVPQQVNKLLNDHGRASGAFPLGVTLSKHRKLFQAQINVRGKRKSLGYYDSPEAAHNAYAAAKESYVRAIAEEYKAALHPRVYENLRNWKL